MKDKQDATEIINIQLMRYHVELLIELCISSIHHFNTRLLLEQKSGSFTFADDINKLKKETQYIQKLLTDYINIGEPQNDEIH